MQISYLATTEQMLNYLTGQGMETQDPNFVKNAVLYRLSAYKKICNYVGYDIISSDYVDEYHDGNGTRKMYLDNRPVTELSSVFVDDIDFTEYFKLIKDFIFCEDMYIYQGEMNVKVSYSAGYNQASMPGDMRHSALQLIALYAGQNGGAGTTIGKSSISTGSGGSESIDTEAETRILDSLSGYRRNDKL